MAQTNLLSPEALAEAAKTIMPVLRKPIALAIAAHTVINPLKVETGLAGMEGVIQFALGRMVENVNAQGEIVLRLDQLQKGIAALGSDFHVLLGDIIWKAELQNASLKSILETLQAPLDTQAKELRKRAEYAYHVGWYDEAIEDLKQAQRLNYQDFALYRTLGNIYYYHRVDLEQALEQYRKAARYASPRDKQQAAEAHLFAAYACSDLQRIEEAISECQKALEHTSNLPAAQYHLAVCQARIGNDAVLSSLESAIRNEAGFYEQALVEPYLTNQTFVMDFLAQLQEEAISAADTLKREINYLLTDYMPDQRAKNALCEFYARFQPVSSYSEVRSLYVEANNLLSRVKKGNYILSTNFQSIHVDKNFFRDDNMQIWFFNSMVWFLNSRLVCVSSLNVLCESGGGGYPVYSLNIWNAHTGEWVKTLWQGYVSPDHFAVSPQGDYVAICNGRRLLVIAVETGEEKLSFLGAEKGEVTSIFVDNKKILIYHQWSEPTTSEPSQTHYDLIWHEIETNKQTDWHDLREFGVCPTPNRHDCVFQSSADCGGPYIILGHRHFHNKIGRAGYTANPIVINVETGGKLELLRFSSDSTEDQECAVVLSANSHAYVVHRKGHPNFDIYINNTLVCSPAHLLNLAGVEYTFFIDSYCSDEGKTLIIEFRPQKIIAVDVASGSVIQHIPYRL